MRLLRLLSLWNRYKYKEFPALSLALVCSRFSLELRLSIGKFSAWFSVNACISTNNSTKKPTGNDQFGPIHSASFSCSVILTIFLVCRSFWVWHLALVCVSWPVCFSHLLNWNMYTCFRLDGFLALSHTKMVMDWMRLPHSQTQTKTSENDGMSYNFKVSWRKHHCHRDGRSSHFRCFVFAAHTHKPF